MTFCHMKWNTILTRETCWEEKLLKREKLLEIIKYSGNKSL